jgi:hypothetical protein
MLSMSDVSIPVVASCFVHRRLVQLDTFKPRLCAMSPLESLGLISPPSHSHMTSPVYRSDRLSCRRSQSSSTALSWVDCASPFSTLFNLRLSSMLRVYV